MNWRVSVDGIDEAENVISWYVSGNVLILYFPDGSVRGISGFIDFECNPTDNPHVG